MSAWSELASHVYEAIKIEAADLWDEFREQEKKFLAELADGAAREAFLLATAQDEPEKELRRTNLRFLKATVAAEILRQQIRLTESGRETLLRLVGVVAQILLRIPVAH